MPPTSVTVSTRRQRCRFTSHGIPPPTAAVQRRAAFDEDRVDAQAARVIEKGRQVHCAVAPFRRRRRPDGTSGLAQGACALGARLRPHRHQRRYLLGCPHEQRIQGQAPLGVDHNAQRLPPGAAFQAAGKRGVIG